MKKLLLIMLFSVTLLSVPGCDFGPVSTNRDTKQAGEDSTKAQTDFVGKGLQPVDFGQGNTFNNVDMVGMFEKLNQRLLNIESQTKITSKSDSSFSQSVRNPFTLLWMGMGMILMVGAYFVFTKFTAAGRAADQLAAKTMHGAKMAVSNLLEYREHINSKLRASDTSTKEHQILQNLDSQLMEMIHKIKERAEDKINSN